MDSGTSWPGVIVILAVLILVGFVVERLRPGSSGRGQIAAVLTAVAAVCSVLPAILYALHGG